MLVSHRYKFIYLKARKVAGTSVESFLERYCVSPEDEPTYTISHDTDYKNDEYGIISSRMGGKGNGKWYNHKPVKMIKEDLPDNIWENYTKICNIRNPFDMMVSWYHHQTGGRGVNQKKFNNFVHNKTHTDVLMFNKNIWSDEENFNFEYIRFENIKEDLDKLIDKLNLPKYDYELPYFKKNSYRGNWKEYYDDISKEIVHEIFEKEINHFNYEF